MSSMTTLNAELITSGKRAHHRQETKLQEARKRREREVLALLDTWTSKEELMTLTGYSRTQIEHTIKALHLEGAIKRGSNYRYRRVDRHTASVHKGAYSSESHPTERPK